LSNSIIKLTCPKCKHTYECIMPRKVQRSNPQNRYFHGAVLPILSRHTGYTVDEMKDLVKSMFLKDSLMIKRKDGIMVEKTLVKGSAELKTDEFEKFMEDIRQWASKELGCCIPNPE